eukprot:2549397-Prymnesium_polylepis.1
MLWSARERVGRARKRNFCENVAQSTGLDHTSVYTVVSRVGGAPKMCSTFYGGFKDKIEVISRQPRESHLNVNHS